MQEAGADLENTTAKWYNHHAPEACVHRLYGPMLPDLHSQLVKHKHE